MTQAQTIPSNAQAEYSVDLQLFDSDSTVNKDINLHFHITFILFQLLTDFQPWTHLHWIGRPCALACCCSPLQHLLCGLAK